MTSFLELQTPTPLSKGMTGGMGKDGEERLRRESRGRSCCRPGTLILRCWTNSSVLGVRLCTCLSVWISLYEERRKGQMQSRERTFEDVCKASDLVTGRGGSLGRRFGGEQVCSRAKY